MHLVDAGDQALVAQVAEREQFGFGAERHQRDQLALVDVQRQRTLVGNMDRAQITVLVEHLDFARQRGAGAREQRQANRLL